MATRMLIDATHEEETRVVIVKGTRLEEFDYETASKKQLKGNIYLAKITRVEPSLQAAFIEYGGNRHGFLPFSEIHPDYYQVPVSDREDILQEDSAAEKQVEAQEDAAATETEAKTANIEASDTAASKSSSPSNEDEEGVVDDADDTLGGLETVGENEDNSVENLGGDDEAEPGHKSHVKRHYKIQEVIKRRQILLIQVVKEERGNKGAALTTYISLPGRYSVLMPNTGRGGGISRKISNPADRKRLKAIAADLDVPEGVGVIIRTAGMNRTKVEIRRDYDFLMRMWDDIRGLTLKSMAPSCVYEEANLIKRSIRDLYNKDVSEILIEGDGGYRVAKDFMRKLMPSHAKKVQPYRDRIPLFHRFQVEQQFASMYNPEVHLKSGGYIVINPTEALVSIDVNSGKATKERSIEDTATKTNLEAAEEIARQLRLRDLAGLVVIDFIDMDDHRNNKAVERRMKDCLKSDRARIQVGRISPFGLMEMSRQRLRPSFLETSTNTCHTCGGSGFVRSVESTALLIIRTLEEEGVRERSAKITVTVHTDVAIYLLNQKRAVIQELENLYGLTIFILADPTTNLNDHSIERERGKASDTPAPQATPNLPKISVMDDTDEATDDAPSDAPSDSTEEAEKESNSAKRRRRRRRRKSRDDQPEGSQTAESGEQNSVSDDAETDAVPAAQTSADEEGDEPRRRRRGKRGGRRRTRTGDDQVTEAPSTSEDASTDSSEAVVIPITTSDEEKQPVTASSTEGVTAPTAESTEDAPKPVRRRRTRQSTRNKAVTTASDDAVVSDEPVKTEGDAEPATSDEASTEKVRPRRRRAPRKKVEKSTEQTVEEKVAETVIDAEATPAPVKKAPRRRTVKKDKPEVTSVESPASPATPVPAAPAPVAPAPVVAPAEPVAPAAPVEAAKPQEEKPKGPPKKGWWRKKG
ncbi:MAG: ribonuclease E/G [Sneathiella sp.]|nr:ribonuclease E/G [Sneathiella sp.]